MQKLILIGCEESGTVRDAFVKKGHDAASLDLLPSLYPGKHIQEDVIEYLESMPDNHFDLIGLHPECTKLCVSGNHVYAFGKPKHQMRLDQVEWVEKLWALMKRKGKSGYLENPIGVLTTMSSLPKPQYIQPYEFGEDASKKTALFLHNLPKLVPTNRFKGRIVEFPKDSGKMVERFSNQTDSGQNKLGPSEDRWKERSKTYQGIADGIANQWLIK
ncbi:MAG: DNA cytosine methyltransferase [Bacteroidota bacterium]